MRVIPLTSILSHKGRGCRCPKRDDSLSLDVRELFKHPLGKKHSMKSFGLPQQNYPGKIRSKPVLIAATIHRSKLKNYPSNIIDF